MKRFFLATTLMVIMLSVQAQSNGKGNSQKIDHTGKAKPTQSGSTTTTTTTGKPSNTGKPTEAGKPNHSDIEDNDDNESKPTNGGATNGGKPTETGKPSTAGKPVSKDTVKGNSTHHPNEHSQLKGANGNHYAYGHAKRGMDKTKKK